MSSSSSEIDVWLEKGIAAAKAGRRDEARQWLMQVVAADERNEQGWLWLSGVVESDEDRVVCLKNVLVLNQEHDLARRGLARLDRAAKGKQNNNVSSYDDVWSREEPICPYCAHPLEPEMAQCPGCERHLKRRRYRYRASSNLHVFWVMLAGIGQLFLLQGFYDVLITRSMPGLIISGVLMGLFFGLAAGVYFRQWWAYWGAVMALGIMILAAIIGVLFPIDLTVVESEMLRGFDPAIANFLGPLAETIGDALRGLQITAVIIALFFAVFRVGSDFDQVTVQETAALKKGLKLAADYHLNARRFAEQEQWATAVLHWQRAAALEPHKYVYLRNLGAAYGRLGHYARSLDVLQSAREIAGDPAQQEDIARLITAVERKQQHDHE